MLPFDELSRKLQQQINPYGDLFKQISDHQSMMDKIRIPPQIWIENYNKVRPAIDASLALQNLISKTDLSAIELAQRKFDTQLRGFAFEVKPVIDMYQRISYMNFYKELEEQFNQRSPLWQFEYDLYENIDEEPEEKEIVVNEGGRLQSLILDIYKDNERIYRIDPREFEEVVAELLRVQGFIVDLTKTTRDGGYDMMAIKFLDHHTPLKFLVECKRHRADRGIGIGIIRSFKEVVQAQHANRGIIVTTSYFSSEAIKKKDETPYLLDFKAKDDIMDWIAGYISNE